MQEGHKAIRGHLKKGSRGCRVIEEWGTSFGLLFSGKSRLRGSLLVAYNFHM